MSTARSVRGERPFVAALAFVVVSTSLVRAIPEASACGGFFCQAVPVNQTAEQIIFRQEGNTITTIVLIQYQGAAEDFSWVVPVAGVPELSTSSNLLFNSFELATRPQFILDVEGQGCFEPVPFGVGLAAPDSLGGESGDGGVQIIERSVVGPFDVVIVTSDDPEAMATWLEENGYDLSDRGRDLLAPYVQMGMNFVALRLHKDADVGDIEPLKMVYQAERPMIPIRLTSVAADPNLGIIVWMLAPLRAIPLNFLHVEVNYARLNWFGGPFAAYASYQQLVTEAMDEAGGHGFATDFAGHDPTLLERMVDPQTLYDFLDQQRAASDPALALVNIGNNLSFGATKLLALFTTHLPLPDGEPQFTYGNPSRLHELFGAEALETARAAIIGDLEATVVEPYEQSLAVLGGDPYITRMYTTLSPEEMTADPVFGYNSELPDQQLDRHATLRLDCVFGTTEWELELGEGTGRDGEVVARGTGNPPFGVPDGLAAQSAIKEAQQLRETGSPTVVTSNSFNLVVVGDDGVARLCGIFPLPMLFLSAVGLLWMWRHGRARRRTRG